MATFHGAVDVGETERLQGLKFGAINLGASSIIAVSDSLRKDIISRTPLRAGKTGDIYNGINTADFQRPHSNAIREQFGWSTDDVLIGSLGNIRAAKGYDVLLTDIGDTYVAGGALDQYVALRAGAAYVF